MSVPNEADNMDLGSLLAKIGEAADRPWDDAISMPPQAYTSTALLELEREKIFRRSWLCVGRADEIDRPGAFLTTQVDRTPVVVVRQKDNSIRAFANVCSHRAMTPVQGAGVARGFSCPYHGWSYGLDGELISAPGMRPGFCKTGKGLPRVGLEQWLGFIFVNLDAGASPLAANLQGLAERLADYQVDRMKTFRRDTLLWRCNWKLALENGVEPFHITATHPNTLAPYLPLANVLMARPNAKYHAYDHRLTEAISDQMPASFIPNTSGSERVRRFSVVGGIYPSMAYAVGYDWVWWISCQPVSIDEVRVDHGVCAPFDLKGEAPDPTDPAYSFMAIDADFMPEDVGRLEGVQRGMAGGFARQSELSPHEEPVHGFIKYLNEALTAPSDA